MKKTSAAACAALLVAVPLLAACGPQSDDRVAGSMQSSTAPTESVPSPAASTPEASAATQPAGVDAPFVSLDCATLQPTALDAIPTDATTIGDIGAVIDEPGSPSIIIGAEAGPASELGVADLTVGDGPEAAAGDTLTVNYCGAGLSSKAVFDSSWAGGQPVTFPLDNLIAGWQEGIPGMKVGGQRLLVIPSALGYGPQGSGPIGPDETLVFVIQLEGIESTG